MASVELSSRSLRRPQGTTRTMVLCVGNLMCIIMGGCFGDPFIYPVQLDAPANTFSLSRKHWDGRVTKVIVWDAMGSDRDALWQIDAVDRVRVTGFAVTVGSTPDGFAQRVPGPPERLTLIPGREYRIGIDVEHIHCLDTRWIAE